MRTFLGLFALLVAGLSLSAQDRSRPLVVVLIGPPASGKTTQADYLRLKYKLPVVSVEELIAKAKPGLRRGDKAVNELVRKHLETMDRYTTLAAEQLVADGVRVGWRHLLLDPPLTFLQAYFLKRGFLDGTEGLAIAYMAALYNFVKYAKTKFMNPAR